MKVMGGKSILALILFCGLQSLALAKESNFRTSELYDLVLHVDRSTTLPKLNYEKLAEFGNSIGMHTRVIEGFGFPAGLDKQTGTHHIHLVLEPEYSSQDPNQKPQHGITLENFVTNAFVGPVERWVARKHDHLEKTSARVWQTQFGFDPAYSKMLNDALKGELLREALLRVFAHEVFVHGLGANSGRPAKAHPSEEVEDLDWAYAEWINIVQDTPWKLSEDMLEIVSRNMRRLSPAQ